MGTLLLHTYYKIKGTIWNAQMAWEIPYAHSPYMHTPIENETGSNLPFGGNLPYKKLNGYKKHLE